MNYSTDNLKVKIREFHPELAQNGVSLASAGMKPASVMPLSSARPGKGWGLIWTRKTPTSA